MERTICIFDGSKCHNFEEFNQNLTKALGFSDFVIENGSQLRDLLQFDDFMALFWKNYDTDILKYGKVIEEVIAIFKDIEAMNTGFHLFLQSSKVDTDFDIIKKYELDCTNIIDFIDFQNRVKELLSINKLNSLGIDDIVEYIKQFNDHYLIIECRNVDYLVSNTGCSVFSSLKYLRDLNVLFDYVRFDLISSDELIC